MLENKKVNKLNEDELEEVSGGFSRGPQYLMTKRGYGEIALLSKNEWSLNNIIRLIPGGKQVFTSGIDAPGKDINGNTITFLNCSYDGEWGFINSNMLEECE
ncbi:MAG: hypothetical protein IK151_01800 [Erysipelotrichaceae bacterium]|nr:hypothetical protein [Erysipelotrichaceae bacterium]